MNLNKISKLIKVKRKELGLTQTELAQRLFVTEKAISRWETGRGTPDISLLIPLSKELNIDVSELLNGEENKKNEIEVLINYNEITKKQKFNTKFKTIIFLYILSILFFLIYLRFEYDPNVELNYFVRLFLVLVSSLLIVFSNKLYGDNYAEKIEDKKKIEKFSLSIVFIYYLIFIFNMVIFARYNNIDSYNLIPFKSIHELVINENIYSILINIFGNFLIFMPMEYFIIKLFNVNKPVLNLLISFIIILMIEVFQFVFKVGVFDIDDIILCVFGMMTFYIFYSLYNKKSKI